MHNACMACAILLSLNIVFTSSTGFNKMCISSLTSRDCSATFLPPVAKKRYPRRRLRNVKHRQQRLRRFIVGFIYNPDPVPWCGSLIPLRFCRISRHSRSFRSQPHSFSARRSQQNKQTNISNKTEALVWLSFHSFILFRHHQLSLTSRDQLFSAV